MSANKSKLQLNQLVYRHLKENGFLSAAEELQRHNPQVTADVSTSLLDVYKSWLKDSKKKKQQKAAKRSGPGGKEKTRTKGKVTTPRKKADKPVKSPTLSEKSASKKRTNGGEKSAKSAVKAKKLKLGATGEAAGGGGDSDSDSSLDVEKWKKLVFQMTETDLAKMEIIDALDPSAPKPKKNRVRKPRAKPPPKSAAPVQERNGVAGQNLQDKEETAAQTTASPESKLAKSGPENPAHVSSAGTPNQKKNLSEAKDKPAVPPSKKNTLTPSKETANDAATEPKKKKKKKKEKEKQEDDAAETVGKVIKGRKTTENKKQKAVKTTEDEKTGTEEDEVQKTANCVEDISESAVQQKKAKKKKKEKTRSENDSAETAEEAKVKKHKKTVDGEKSSELNSAEERNTDQTVTSTNKVGKEELLEEGVKEKKVKRKKKMEETLAIESVEAQENIEQSIEDLENPELIVKKKKAKKKKKESADGEKNPEEVQEIKAKRKNPDEDISEQIDVEKSKKKHKADHREATSKHPDKDIKSAPDAAKCDEKREHQQETTSSPKKKKKKSKLKSDEAPEEAGVCPQDVTATQTTPADSHRKKKKSVPES